MPSRQNLLLLQLPRLDPDVTTPGENVMLAAAGLQSALDRSSEGVRWELLPTPTEQETADNAALLAAITALRPDAIGATLYLWNIERTLRLLAAIRKLLPRVHLVVGGPEVAREHPLLFPNSPALPGPRMHPAVDVAVIGEGEAVFPAILSAFRRKASTDWRTVAWQRDRQPRWGARSAPVRPLRDLVPPADHPSCRPDAYGMAYLETTRGCPMRCAFCCYNIRRAGWSSLPPSEVTQRIRTLRRRGARKIRLVDPTFNAHPDFRAILAAMRHANPDRKVRFFVELRADTLMEADAAHLAAAGVAEAEVGVQSTDPVVLRAIHRPVNLERTMAGIDLLQRHGIRPTMDFMYGLPRQGMEDISRSLDILARFPKAHPQFLPTLLLPGTELRDRCRELRLRSQPLPPYRVLATDRLNSRQLAAIEALAQERLGGFDSPTRRFVGTNLPDLFPAHSGNRQALFFRGEDLFAQQQVLAARIRDAVRREPDILWQFVLAPTREEPLDLLDFLIATLRHLPSHWLDRLLSPSGVRRLAARRLFVQLPRGRAFDLSWRYEAEALLGTTFH